MDSAALIRSRATYIPNSPPPLVPEEPPPEDVPLSDPEEPEEGAEEAGGELDGGVTGCPDSAPNSPLVTCGDSLALEGELVAVSDGAVLGEWVLEAVCSSPPADSF
jgi:hypothetical protein